MWTRRLVAACGVWACAAVVAAAQNPPEPPSQSVQEALEAAAKAARGATVANVVPGPFRAQLVVDNRFKARVKNPDGTESPDPRDRTGKIHCLVCENGLSPTIAIFVRADIKGADANGGVGKLVREANDLAKKYQSDKLSAFAMFLRLEAGDKLVKVATPDGGTKDETVDKEYPDDEKRDAHAAEVKGFAAAVNADLVPFGLVPTASRPITAFGIADTTPVTVIIYNRLRMARRWELTPDEVEKALPDIRAATEEMMGIKKKQ